MVLLSDSRVSVLFQMVGTCYHKRTQVTLMWDNHKMLSIFVFERVLGLKAASLFSRAQQVMRAEPLKSLDRAISHVCKTDRLSLTEGANRLPNTASAS